MIYPTPEQQVLSVYRVLVTLATLLLLAAAPVQAALHLQLEHQHLTEEQRQTSQQLMDEVFAVLPPRLVDALDQAVPVGWSQRLPDNVMGRASPGGKITLNQRWLEPLLNDSDIPNIPGRQHPTLRMELKATLIHELAHLYDRGRFWETDERQLLRYCRNRERVQGNVGLPGECRGQTDRQFTLSDAPRWLDLAGWPQQAGRRGLRESVNAQHLRSPDTYELHSPQEFTAVNLEYFLLDPLYSCRRPALASYLSRHFAWTPAHTQSCATELPYLNARLDSEGPGLAWLDPERIYEVHYLLAEPDESWAGRWGHSMLRLVICAPGRPRGAACMLDLQHHMVLSYRAFVDDVQLSSWDGLTGVYPSRLFILPLQRVIDEYTRTELRSLSSVPIRLSREQVTGLAVQATTQHWSYDGTYYFVSNNCAVETLKLLRSGSNQPQLVDLDSQTPYGLLQLLEARNLADTQPLQNPHEARRLGYQFDSYQWRYQQLFSIARDHLQLPQPDSNDWLALDAGQRRPWLKRADLRPAAALLVLEDAALRRHVQQIQHDLKLRYFSEGHKHKPLREAGQLMQALLSGSGFLSRPADLLPDGYGLPQPEDMHYMEQAIRLRKTALLDMADDLDEQVSALLQPGQRAELDAINDNLVLLRERIRLLHEQSGGLAF